VIAIAVPAATTIVKAFHHCLILILLSMSSAYCSGTSLMSCAADISALTTARQEARGTWLTSTFNVATKREEKRGLCVVAQRSFEPGEVILSSEPYTFVLFPAFKDERCLQCFVRTDKLMRCASCKLARSVPVRIS